MGRNSSHGIALESTGTSAFSESKSAIQNMANANRNLRLYGKWFIPLHQDLACVQPQCTRGNSVCENSRDSLSKPNGDSQLYWINYNNTK